MGTYYLILAACFAFCFEPIAEGNSHRAIITTGDYYKGGCRFNTDDIIVSTTIRKNFKKGLKKFEIHTLRQHVLVKRINKQTYSISDLDLEGNIILTTYCTYMGKTK